MRRTWMETAVEREGAAMRSPANEAQAPTIGDAATSPAMASELIRRIWQRGGVCEERLRWSEVLGGRLRGRAIAAD
jgi:hypothetical protein